jgi:uncharacterized protein (DUF983 family)
MKNRCAIETADAPPWWLFTVVLCVLLVRPLKHLTIALQHHFPAVEGRLGDRE